MRPPLSLHTGYRAALALTYPCNYWLESLRVSLLSKRGGRARSKHRKRRFLPVNAPKLGFLGLEGRKNCTKICSNFYGKSKAGNGQFRGQLTRKKLFCRVKSGGRGAARGLKLALKKWFFGLVKKLYLSVCWFYAYAAFAHKRERGVERERREIRKLKGTTLGYSHTNTPNDAPKRTHYTHALHSIHTHTHAHIWCSHTSSAKSTSNRPKTPTPLSLNI